MTENEAVQTEQAEIGRVAAYREWLGVTSPMPTYYEVLGLPALESEVDAIFEAGREAKRKLRSYQVGRYKRQALELLAEVGQAVSVLTNPEKRRAYDNELLKGWMAAADELFQQHCVGHTGEPAAVEAWMNACRRRGVPVARLLPWIIRTARRNTIPWPDHEGQGIDLLSALWIYRDVVVLGQCVELMKVEKRVSCVKRAQQALGISGAMALVIADGVSRSRRVFEPLRPVRQGKTSPETALLRLARRLRRLGGRPGHRSKALLAVAALLGKNRQTLEKVLARMDEPTADLPPARRAASAARRAGRAAPREKAVEVRSWVKEHPQLLVVAAVVGAFVFLVLAVLVAAGVWNLGGSSAQTPPTSSELVQPRPPAPLTPAPVGPAAGKPSGTGQPAQPLKVEGLEELIKKYPAGKPGEEETGGPQKPTDPSVAKPPPKEKPKGDKPPPPKGFFGVPPEPRPKG